MRRLGEFKQSMGRISQAVLKHREDASAYYWNNRERVLAVVGAYNYKHRKERREKERIRRELHPIKHARLKREEYRRNRSTYLASAKVYGNKHRLKRAANSRAWRLKHPKRTKAHQTRSKHNYRSRLFKVSGSFTRLQFRRLCKLYNYSCVGCGKSETRLFRINRMLVPDHVKPVSLGGLNSIENIQPLCHTMKGGRGSCNLSKHAKEIDYRNTSLARLLVVAGSKQ